MSVVYGLDGSPKGAGRDHIGVIGGIGLGLLMAAATVLLTKEPRDWWCHIVLIPAAVGLVGLCTQDWGVWSDSLGIRRPKKWWWIGLGSILGFGMRWALLPLWLTLGVSRSEAMVAVYAAPVWEELIFRGLLCSAILSASVRANWTKRRQPTSRRIIALLISALVFSACHLVAQPGAFTWGAVWSPGFLDRTISGFVFGLIWMYSRSLLPGMAMHASTNLALILTA